MVDFDSDDYNERSVRASPDKALMEEVLIMKERYLRLVRDALTGMLLRTTELRMTNIYLKDGEDMRNFLAPMDPGTRKTGSDYPVCGLTMVGELRLDNVKDLLIDVIIHGVKGDYVDCGTWRGGAAIYAKAIIDSYDRTRHVFVADSFKGLPKASLPVDNDVYSRMAYLRVPLEKVQQNFRSFDLLDDRVHFCEGYFVDSLPVCPVRNNISVLRADGDMYVSTMDILYNMYPKLSIGGYVIMDDYYGVDETHKASEEFRSMYGITSPIVRIDGFGAYWKKTFDPVLDIEYYLVKIAKVDGL